MSTTSSPSAGAPAAPATRREWIGLAVIALPCAVYAMDLTVLNLALPALTADLHPGSSQLLWIIDIYGFLVAGFLITMGTLGDRIGRRKLLLVGAAAFAVASTVAAFARSAEMLILMRALLGIAGATLAPSTLSLIRNMFHVEHERQFAIGVWIAAFSVGSAIGPLVGGLLLEYFWWGSVFLAAVPAMVLLLAVGPWLLPEFRDPGAGRIDPASVVLSLAAVLGSIYGFKQIAEHGPSWPAAGCIAAGLALGVAFVRRQGRLAYPLLDTTLFRRPAFSATIAAYALSCLAMFGIYIFITQFLQGVLGLSPLHAGLATVPWSLTFVVGSLLAPRLARRVPAVAIVVWGLVVAATGFALVALAGGPWTLPLLVAGTIVMAAGMAPVFTIGNELIITTAPPERAGAASALSETSSEFSGALGVALLGSAGMWLYRGLLQPGLPAELPGDAAEAALGSIGAAVAAGEALGGPAGEVLATQARAAFTQAMQAVAVLGGVVLLAASLVAARILRHGLEAAQAGAAQRP